MAKTETEERHYAPPIRALRALNERVKLLDRVGKVDRKKDVRRYRKEAVRQAQDFVKSNGLAELFGLENVDSPKRKDPYLKFLERTVAENILFSSSYFLKHASDRLPNFLKKEGSGDVIAIIGVAFSLQEKINKHALNDGDRNISAKAEQIGFYVADLFHLLREYSLTNHTAFSLSVSEETMSGWKKRWDNFSDLTSLPKHKPQGK